MTVRFEVDGEIIVSKKMEHAYRRNVVKLGEEIKEKGPGVSREPLYVQIHPASEFMQRQENGIMEEMAKAIGGKSDVAIRVAKSRNPGGVYSDSAGGAQSGEYVVGKK